MPNVYLIYRLEEPQLNAQITQIHRNLFFLLLQTIPKMLLPSREYERVWKAERR